MAAPSDPSPAVALAAGLEALIEESRALRGDMNTATRARRRENLVNVGISALLAVFIILVLVVAGQNNDISRQSAETNQRIADCTVAGGDCYDQGAARTSQVVDLLVKSNVAIVQCSRELPGASGPVFDAAFERCVNRRITAQARPAPGPSPVPAPSPSI